MPRLTDTMGLCYRCGQRPAVHDYAPRIGGVVGLCGSCLPREAVRANDGVFEPPASAPTHETPERS